MGAAAQVTVVVLAAVVRAVVVAVAAVVSVFVTAFVMVMVVLTVEVDWRYWEQKTLALADRVGFRRARSTLSALQPVPCQRPVLSETAYAGAVSRWLQYVPRVHHVCQEARQGGHH